jgi:ribosome-binding ATPase YchF (GTP1/OBG family)
VDPARDREVIEFELALADLATVEKRLERTRRAAKSGEKEAVAELPVLEKAQSFLGEGKGLWEARLSPDELKMLAPLSLLTTKPVLYAANVTDAELSGHEGKHLQALRAAVKASGEHAEIVPFSAKIEADLRSCRRRHSHGLRAWVHSRRDGRLRRVRLAGGWKGAREKAVVRSEGKEDVVQDGDVMLFRFNVDQVIVG